MAISHFLFRRDDMSRDKSIQISEQLFLKIAQYFLLPERRDTILEKSIVNGLSDKLEAIIRHDLYTKYKTAPTNEQKEKARLEYLEHAGIPENFRW